VADTSSARQYPCTRSMRMVGVAVSGVGLELVPSTRGFDGTWMHVDVSCTF